jgi:AraC family transcriptional regulator
MVVKNEFEKHGIHPQKVSFGEVVLPLKTIDEDTRSKLNSALTNLGFEILDDSKAKLIEGIKAKIIQLVHHNGSMHLKTNWSDILSNEVNYEYNYISNLFSSIEGSTLEQYIIKQKIERVKELLLYDELNLSQIADKLGYSSVSHLSGQFKKVTGFTPSELKKARNVDQLRKPLDSVS